MSRPKLIDSDKKNKLSITISNEAYALLKKITNKSKFIETIIIKYKNETS